MKTWLSARSEGFFALLRIVAGLLFACHGAQKLFGAFGGKAMTGVPMMLVAGIVEFGCGLLIAIGLFARVAAFISAGEMAVGYFLVHFPQGFWPIENKGEPAVINCFLFLFIMAHGAGKYSLSRK